MPTRNINLTHEQDEFVESIVRAGEYQNASEAIRDAVRALQQRRREDALKLERLRLRIEAGIDDLDRGEFVEVDDEDLEAFFDTLREAEKKPLGLSRAANSPHARRARPIRMSTWPERRSRQAARPGFAWRAARRPI